MQFQTPVNISKRAPLSAKSRVLCIGSCFAEEVCERMKEHGIDAVCNPFGTMYNPLSIGACMERLLEGRVFDETELVMQDGLYHSMLHHGRFSCPTPAETLRGINEQLTAGQARLLGADVLIVTLGTAWVYEMDGQVVGNCHKLPENRFTRRRMSVDEVTACLRTVLQHPMLREKRVILTVSPIRHKKDGLHENQLSKATLLLAVDELARENERWEYFPSYELVLDELRDYRFYAEDMVHPSKQAVDYVWERFEETYFSAADREQMRLAFGQWKARQHRAIKTLPA